MKLSNFLRVLPLLRFVTSYAPTDAPTIFCADSALKFSVFDNTFDPPSEFNVNCNFIKQFKDAGACEYEHAASICPVTCGACEPCRDSTGEFEIKTNKKTIQTTCDKRYCKRAGVFHTCRATCGSCPSMAPSGTPTSVPSTVPSSAPSTVPSSTPSDVPSTPPSNSPTVSAAPSLAPSDSPSMVPSHSPSVFCQDSTLRFDSYDPILDHTYGKTSCEYISKNTKERCEFKNVRAICPLTCGSCEPCADTKATFYTEAKPNTELLCATMKKRNCKKEGVFHACRATCGTCPSMVPSNAPSFLPSAMPSMIPSVAPSDAPTTVPSMVPTDVPSFTPSVAPSSAPSTVPSFTPSNVPSKTLSLTPTITNVPSLVPSDLPSMEPSQLPSVNCQDSTLRFDTISGPAEYRNVECNFISKDPTERCAYDHVRTICPVTCDSCEPCADTKATFYIEAKPKTKLLCATMKKTKCKKEGVFHACRERCGTCPSMVPSNAPSSEPSAMPSKVLSVVPSDAPSTVPSAVPSDVPSSTPSAFPSKTPSVEPSEAPSTVPSVVPTDVPSSTPSTLPSHAPSIYCLDSVLPFSTKKESSDRYTKKKCSWVAQNKNQRCKYENAVSHCPLTCGGCEPCADSQAKFIFKGKKLKCEDITSKVCLKTGIFHSCRATCGLCPSSTPSMDPSSTPSDAPTEAPSHDPSSDPSVNPSMSPSSVPSSTPSDKPSSAPTDKPSSTPTAPTPSPSVDASDKIRIQSLFTTNEFPLCLEPDTPESNMSLIKSNVCGGSDTQYFKIGESSEILSLSPGGIKCLMRDEVSKHVFNLVLTSCSSGIGEDKMFYKSFDDKIVVGSNMNNLMRMTMEGEIPKPMASISFKPASTSYFPGSAQNWNIKEGDK